MKRRNINKTIMQRGGLMIEALAMLGLIAVVTPTMYKKSAERTMEVEDINTAATIRTVMNAANDYVSSNYSWLISQMNANGQTVRDITAADIRPFLPYGFNLSQPLHNYNAPILKVKRPSTDSNNLTAFALFPATAAPEDGIGQERTSRIAALVGSNGGYKPTANTARGVGGIWSLNEGDFRDVFGNQGNQYSIVTASTDIINSATNNEVDMTKYLQRGSDNAPGTEWKNTMRTDLYMGGPNQDGDIYENLTGPYSIRNIKSLIVGTNNGEEAGNYGLYIAPEAANPNAYVHGSLKAGEGQFKADNANLQFGGTEGAWNFVVDTAGKVMNRGDLELASDSGVWNDIKIGALRNNGADKYLIQGSRSHAAASGGMSEPYDYGSLTFIDDLMKLTGAKNVKDKKVKIMENGWAKDENGNAYEDIKYQTYVHSSEDAGIPEFPVEIDANAKVKGLLAAGQIDTNKIRTASLSVGSEYVNSDYQWMTVDKDGVLIADPSMDTDNPTNTKNRINVNKDQIVLSVDKEAKNVNNPRGLSGDVREHGQETSNHDVQIVMNAKTYKGEEGGGFEEKGASIEIKAPNTSIHGNSTTVSGQGTLIQAGTVSDYGVTGNNLDKNQLLMRNDNMQIRMTDKETVIGPRAQTVTGADYAADDKYKVRTTFHKGNLDLLDSNLNILDANKHSVFSVGTNGKLDGFTTPYADIYTVAEGQKFGETEINSKKRKENLGRAEKYDVAAHGNIIFTSNLVPEVTKDGIIRNSLHRTYLSMGDAINSFAAVNIVGLSVDSSDGGNEFAKVPSRNKSNIVFVDQVASSKYNNKDLAEPGTIYIRKGYLEAVGASDAVSKNDKGEVVSSTAGAKDAPGVVVASRFVANNPTSATNTTYGTNVPNLFTDKESSNYGESGVVRYDTYMVNPAYTSVMHDIKLTTRGGARLSDVLPDFINKGIYVVTNSYQEQAGNELKFLGVTDYSTSAYNVTMDSVGEWNYKAVGDNSYVLGKDAEVWGSPFLGTVPAPQCPPGYGRVITLAPSTFNMGTAGYLRESKSKNGGYYVYPDIASSVDIKASKSTYEKAEIVAGTSSSSGSVEKASISLENSSELGIASDSLKVKDAKNFATAKYVLTGDEHSAKPLTFQQSTWLKTLTVPIYSSKDEPHYVQAWAAIMGFIYPEPLYKSFITKSDGVNKRDATKLRLHDGNTSYVSTSYYWNIFPVIAKSLEGYATVYCYFDRSNLFKGYETDTNKVDYTNYIDKLDYMKGGKYAIYPKNFKKGSFATDETGSSAPRRNYKKYKERLNDPELKYNEVW